jgi:hypothetical protein
LLKIRSLPRKISKKEDGWVQAYVSFAKIVMRQVQHLFVNCSFTSAVWNKVTNALNLPSGWTGPTVNDCYENWTKLNPYYSSLPAFLSWYIWNERNLTIFDAGSPSCQKVSFKAIEQLVYMESRKKTLFLVMPK